MILYVLGDLLLVTDASVEFVFDKTSHLKMPEV